MPLKPRPASVPVGYADKNITRLRSDQLQKLLGKENIDFDGNAEKHELQALWTLFRMGLQDVADKLIEETADFWELSVVRQVEILKELGLPTTGNKLEHVVSYVESIMDKESDSDEEVEASPPVAKNGAIAVAKGKGKEKAGNDKTSTFKAKAHDVPLSSKIETSVMYQPHPYVVNLLVTIIFTDISKTKNMSTLQGCPCASVDDLKTQLNALPTFKMENALREAFNSHPSKNVLRWICEKYGKDFSVAAGKTKIPGLSAAIPQFIINRHPKKQVTSFQAHFARDSNQSMVLFHGTNIDSIRSILATGFNPTVGSGLYMAEDPLTSSYYAGCHYTDEHFSPTTTYRNFGALFGCEVTGYGEPLTNTRARGIHVVMNPSRVIARYVFLLPMADIAAMYQGVSIPRRADMEKAMLAGFKVLRSQDNEPAMED